MKSTDLKTLHDSWLCRKQRGENGRRIILYIFYSTLWESFLCHWDQWPCCNLFFCWYKVLFNSIALYSKKKSLIYWSRQVTSKLNKDFMAEHWCRGAAHTKRLKDAYGWSELFNIVTSNYIRIVASLWLFDTEMMPHAFMLLCVKAPTFGFWYKLDFLIKAASKILQNTVNKQV